MSNYEHTMKEILENIRTHRKIAGWSQGLMADKLGVSRPFYNQAEKGKRVISLRRLIQISNLFGVTLDKLTKPRTIIVEDPTEQPPSPPQTTDEVIAQILGRAKKDTPDEDEPKRKRSYTEAKPRHHHSSVRRTEHSSWTYNPSVAP